MSEVVRERVSIISNLLQTVVLIIAVAAVMLEMGRKDQTLQHTVQAVSELRDITVDLATTQVSLSTSADNMRARIDEIGRRLESLERR